MDLVDSNRKGDIREPFIKAQMDPLCGWPWLDENRRKEYPEQGITVFFNGKALVAVPSTSTKRGLIRAVMTMAADISKKYSRKEP